MDKNSSQTTPVMSTTSAESMSSCDGVTSQNELSETTKVTTTTTTPVVNSRICEGTDNIEKTDNDQLTNKLVHSPTKNCNNTNSHPEGALLFNVQSVFPNAKAQVTNNVDGSDGGGGEEVKTSSSDEKTGEASNAQQTG